MSADQSIIDVLAWVRAEQDAWATTKYSVRDEDMRVLDLLDESLRVGPGPALLVDSGWILRLNNYLSRAITLGPDTAVGQQAMLKAASTAVALAAAFYRVSSLADLPRAGVPSGEV